MHFLLVSLRKDWARALRDPSQFAIALGIPVVLAVLMSLVFGRTPAAPHGRLLVNSTPPTTGGSLVVATSSNTGYGLSETDGSGSLTLAGGICGQRANQADHVDPKGPDELGNLQSLCPVHHSIKSSREGGRAMGEIRRRIAAAKRRPAGAHPGLRPPA